MYKIEYSRLFILVIMVNLAVATQAQNVTPKVKAAELQTKLLQDKKVKKAVVSEKLMTPDLITFDQDIAQPYLEAEAPQLMRSKLKMRNADRLDYKNNVTTVDNIKINRYQQFFKNVKVEHGSYLSVAKENKLGFLTGEYYNIDENTNIAPSLSEEDALQYALTSVGAEKYMWEDWEEGYMGMVASEIAAEQYQMYQELIPVGELVFVDDYSTPEVDLDLAYKFNIYAAYPLSRAYIYVNAHNGKIMLQDAIIKHASEFVEVQTRYGGLQAIGVTRISGNDPNSGSTIVSSHPDSELTYIPGSLTWVLSDETRGKGIETYDLNAVGGIPLSVSQTYLQAKVFTDVDNNWTLAQHKRGDNVEAENDDTAWDAHWGAMMVYDYWQDRHNRKSYDNQNAKIKSYVHSGVQFDNAFWNGTAMTYGDGSYDSATGTGSFAPLTSMDVCAHEVGHAVCTNTSNLVYQLESGAMNEGFSDIWAACVENYVRLRFSGEDFNWIEWGIGEQIDERDGGIQPDPNNLGNGAEALRWMDNPNRAGNPSAIGDADWTNVTGCTPNLANDQCGVHNNSGVLNKWFFLITQGEAASNYLSNAYNVTGLGFLKAEKIAFGTEVLLAPNATFAQAKLRSLEFTAALYGPCGPEVKAVDEAWYAVNNGPRMASCNAATGFFTTAQTVTEFSGFNQCGSANTIEVNAYVTSLGTINIGSQGSMATLGVDFDYNPKTYTNTTGAFEKVTILVDVFDDALVDNAEENIVLTLTSDITPTAQDILVHTITIKDDEEPLQLGVTNISLIPVENFDALANGTLPTGWQTFELKSATNHFGKILANNPAAGGVTSGIMGVYNNGTPVFFWNDRYDDTQSSEIFIRAPKINARGKSNVKVNFNWEAGGERGTNNQPLDYAELMYSLDGTNYIPVSGQKYGGTGSLAFGTTAVVLPDAVNNKEFFVAVRWINVAPSITPGQGNLVYSFAMDNFSVTASSRRIESNINTEVVRRDVPETNEVFFYDPIDGDLLVSISSPNGTDCTVAAVIAQGAAKQVFDASAFYTSKIFEITSASDEPYTVSLYYTAAELAPWTSGEIADLNMLKYTTEDITEANDINAVLELNPVIDNQLAQGYVKYSATFIGFSRFTMTNLTALPSGVGVDLDGDGVLTPFDLNDNNVCIPNPDFGGCDQDMDGLTNNEEIGIGTNPIIADTDNDGFNDGNENTNASDPLDPCSPSLTAGVCDQDMDGLTNSEEATINTNPTNPDTDGDSFRDGEEKAANADPLNACDPSMAAGPCDQDQDNLTNDEEVMTGTNSQAADTDGDGENDDVEIGNDLNNPTDTDNDARIDALESSILDEDGDEFNDELDVANTDPCIPNAQSLACQATLPVEFVSLSAKPSQAGIMVQWTTATEWNTVGFEIQRTDTENGTFEKIAWVDSKGSYIINDYQWMDKNVQTSTLYYYRLKQIDTNGAVTFSNIVTAQLVGKPSLEVNVFPNPANDIVAVELQHAVSGLTKVTMVAMDGRIVLSKQYQIENAATIQLDISSLSAGVYFISVGNDTAQMQRKLIVQ